MKTLQDFKDEILSDLFLQRNTLMQKMESARVNAGIDDTDLLNQIKGLEMAIAIIQTY